MCAADIPPEGPPAPPGAPPPCAWTSAGASATRPAAVAAIANSLKAPLRFPRISFSLTDQGLCEREAFCGVMFLCPACEKKRLDVRLGALNGPADSEEAAFAPPLFLSPDPVRSSRAAPHVWMGWWATCLRLTVEWACIA